MTLNRLAAEKSPYLLQHSRNPVDWYPWGAEAFERARADDRPIFLSIGYSTCHWCHVMERESFEDPDVARLLNEAFVCVKVDREERPDVDAIYMAVCQLLTGSGGWPLTIIMTPDSEPFFAGTYFPRSARNGRIGMLDLVPQIRSAWSGRRADVRQSAHRIRSALERMAASDIRSRQPGSEEIEAAYGSLKEAFDPLQGGFGRAPKFPSPHNLSFLLRYWRRTGDTEALRMVETTLRAMRRGGIFDQLGYGFHRYSTDARWFVPHFEKMLYDQALMAIAYLEAFQATGAEEYGSVAAEIVSYVLRDMADPGGAFHAAEDADSEGEEGKYYLWTDQELRDLLGPDRWRLAREVYGVVQAGNFADEATGLRNGRNILHLGLGTAETAHRLGIAEAELRTELESVRAILLNARGSRVRPVRDDKVLTDWNGLMIAALSRAGVALGEVRYTSAAEKAARFLLSSLTDERGRLLHRYRDGEAAIPALADDYAFLVWGLTELYQATYEAGWLEHAVRLNRDFIEHFLDPDGGGFFLTADDAEQLLVRSRESHDGAVPSANSVALANLLRLARLTGETALDEYAAATARGLGSRVALAPASHTHFLSGVDFALGPAREVVVVGDPADPATEKLLGTLRRRFLPRTVSLLKRPSVAGPDSLSELVPFTRPLESVAGRPAAYVCRDFVCERPVTVPEDLDRLLGLSGTTER